MSPTHTRKGTRKYRYYVSQAVLQYRAQEAGSVERVPAQTVEDLVITRMVALLRDSSRLYEAMAEPDLTASARKSAMEEANGLAQGFTALPATKQTHWLGELAARVVLGRKKLTIAFSPDGLRRAFLATGSHRFCRPRSSKPSLTDTSRQP